MNSLKKFIFKYKIPCAIVILLIASFGVYFLAFANEDALAGKINATITSVNQIDGSEPFDTTEGAGNDTDSNNNIVRSFDQITYSINFSLDYSDDIDLDDIEQSDADRSILVDVLIPKLDNISLAVSNDRNTIKTLPEEDTVTIDGIEYDHYITETTDRYNLSESSSMTIDVYLSNIIAPNGTEIEPIIRVRESTSTDTNNYSEAFKANKFTVSAKKSYGVQLFAGNSKNDDSNDTETTLPVGIVVYLISHVENPEKGYYGVEVPNSLDFDLDISYDYNKPIQTMIKEVTTNLSDENKYLIDGLPTPTYNINENGKSTVQYNPDEDPSKIKISLTDLNFHTNTIDFGDQQFYYLTSKVLTVKTKSATSKKKDIIYEFKYNNIPISKATIIDNYVPMIGNYSNVVNIYNSSQTKIEDGKAIFNTNEEFYIEDSITYGNKQGDNLEKGFVNYIKIDNSAFKVIDIGNEYDEEHDYFMAIYDNEHAAVTNSYNYNISYGVGEWNPSYFKLKQNAPSYCPTNINTLTKEQLMNYYGGPCIEENSNVKWFNTINEATSDIMLFKLVINDEFEATRQVNIKLKALVKKNYSNVGNTFQIVSRGQTIDDNENIYYFPAGDIVNQSVSSMESDNVIYNKTQYSGVNKDIILHSPTNSYGESILVSAFKTSVSSMNIYDSYNSLRTGSNIYSGVTDPLEIVITPSLYKTDYDATFTSASVIVKLPNTLEIDILNGDRRFSSVSSETIDGVQYNNYLYSFTENEIKYDDISSSGTIPVLKIHAHIKITTSDKTLANVLATTFATLKDNNSDISFTNVEPVSMRGSSASFTIRNVRKINNIGGVSSNYIDENGTYQYNMKAANISGENANLDLIYILPYQGDLIGEGSEFVGTIQASINGTLSSGYTAYYTTDNSKTVLTGDINKSNVTWTRWQNYNTPVKGMTAIKIVSANPILNNQYFHNESGITLNVSTNGNEQTNDYYNNFYIIQRDATVCADEDMYSECQKTQISDVSYSSNVSKVSVYDRYISGYIFEDSDYNGLYSKDEARLKDIYVELYKLNAPVFDANNPLDYISDKDEKIMDSATDRKGSYKFDGLLSGNYYVKYTFNCDKYTVTEKNVQDLEIGSTELIDSDANMIPISPISEDEENNDKENVCYAVSNIITLNNSKVVARNIDLGLKIRQNFDIEMNKYITNVVVTSSTGTKSYSYKNKSKVKIDIRNLKNTSFKVTYNILIKNSKYFPGTIGNIVEMIPEGMTFDPKLIENDGWYESDGYLYYSKLDKTLIMPGEKYSIKIVLNLKTDSGGDYINFVTANNLQIMPISTSFFEIPEAGDYTEIDAKKEESK